MLSRLRRWDRATSSRVSHFVAISETVRGRIARCYRRDSRVIQPPVDAAFYTPDPTISRATKPISSSRHWCLISGSIRQSWPAPTRASADRHRRRPRARRLEAMAGPSVRFLGWQPDDVIRDHYRRCRALLFPGEEDFGIVPIEALACGAPVIALGRGGAAETVDADVGGIYAEPTSDALRDTLDAWESRGCRHDPLLGRRRAEAFALPLFRDRLLAFLAEVVASTGQHAVPPAPHLDLA